MKKHIAFLLITLFSIVTLAGISNGPAPNSGDGVADGPGWAGDWVNVDRPGVNRGPAPNAGDGIPDGPGW